ncbi:MAG: efflux RND transporter periplasmic adaptor subunit [Gammaproteobacteria bacterium]
MNQLIVSLVCLFPVMVAAQEPTPPAPVIVAEVRVDRFVDRVEALGTLKANESILVTANVTETVSAIYFDDGQRVELGQVLVEMTSAEEHALLEEARVRVAEAERQYQRVKSLAAQRSASESLLDERKRDVETARAVLVALEARLADRLLKAPFAGVLGLRNISPGALVEPGDLITTLDDDSVMKLDFAVPSVFLTALEPGLGITAKARAYGNRRFVGEIRSIDSRVDPVTRSIQVRALIPNPQRTLKPGILMQVELLRNPRDALVVPESALLQQRGEHFVMVVGDGGIAQRRAIRIGARRPGEVEVVDGVAAGDQVITHGNDKIRSGQRVEVLALDDGSRGLREMLESAR